MNLDFILYLIVGLVVLFVTFGMLMIRELQKRKIKINFLLIRFYFFKYVNQYKKITTQEFGKPGRLYVLWLVVIGLELLLFLVWLTFKYLI